MFLIKNAGSVLFVISKVQKTTEVPYSTNVDFDDLVLPQELRPKNWLNQQAVFAHYTYLGNHLFLGLSELSNITRWEYESR